MQTQASETPVWYMHRSCRRPAFTGRWSNLRRT